jgi:branched-chain amino acid aminotransferase
MFYLMLCTTDLNEAIIKLIGVNKLEECYVRPVAYRGYNSLGVDPSSCPVDVAIAVWPWGQYLGEEALENGVSVCFSSWNRIAPNTMPAMAKSGANYANSQLIKLEAMRKGALVTPTFAASILPGITRSSIIKLAEAMGIKVIERNIPREALYLADEVFFTGSAAEVTPISKIDNIQVGSGKRGPITEKLQKAFFDIVRGKVEDKYGWLTIIPKYKEVTV